MSAAEKISRLAVGRPSRSPGGETIRIPADLTQEEHIDGLADRHARRRGGPLHVSARRRVRDPDPADARPRRARRRAERAARSRAAAGSRARAAVHGETAAAGAGIVRRRSAVARQRRSAPEGPRAGEGRSARASAWRFRRSRRCCSRRARQPYQAHFNSYRHPRIQPAIYSVSIIGPYAPKGSGRHAEPPADLRVAAGRARATRTRAARQHPVGADAARLPASGDRRGLQGPLELYRKARADGRLRRRHRDGAVRGAGEPASSCSASNRIPPASRRTPPIASAISSWRRGSRSSSGAAFRTTSCSTWPIAGKLHEPAVLERQVRRMLADAPVAARS